MGSSENNGESVLPVSLSYFLCFPSFVLHPERESYFVAKLLCDEKKHTCTITTRTTQYYYILPVHVISQYTRIVVLFSHIVHLTFVLGIIGLCKGDNRGERA